MTDPEIVFMDQLLHHRAVSSQIENTLFNYDRRSSWFPRAQWEQYSRISEIYADCFDKYGAEIFGIYAKRNRLHEKYIQRTMADIQKENRQVEISMDHLAAYKFPRTTNGVYGSIRPSKLFLCMEEPN
ncbi:hypothetical protein KR059_009073 [Drosophila kikkawai]|nr:hypothetical protein KR059_009073 [Drosophila kikkawai]